MAYFGAVDKIMTAEAVTAMKSKDQVNMADITAEQQQRNADVPIASAVVDEAHAGVVADE